MVEFSFLGELIPMTCSLCCSSQYVSACRLALRLFFQIVSLIRPFLTTETLGIQIAALYCLCP